MLWVKICGITNLLDARAAAELGADAVGFVFAPSPRQVSPELAKEIIVCLEGRATTVGVFVNEDLRRMTEIREYCGLDLLQLHGDETEHDVAGFGAAAIKAVRVRDRLDEWQDRYPTATLLLDTYVPDAHGGTGKTFDWSLAVDAARRRPIILAGGLTPDNVAAAVELVRPFGVDVSSGVEKEPGRKDHEKLADYIRRAKAVG